MNVLKFDNKNCLLFIVGLFSITQIRLIGAFPLSEFITVVFALFLFPKMFSFFKYKRFRNVWLLLCCWLFGAFVSDIYNNSILNDVLKGLGTIILFSIDILFSYWALKDNYNRMIYFLLGAFLSSFLQLYIFPSQSLVGALTEYGVADIWDTWAVYFVAPIVLILAFLFYSSYRKWVIAIIFLYALYSVFNMSRNQFLIYSIVGSLLLVIRRINAFREGCIKQIFIQKQSFRYLLLLLLCLIVVKSSYEYLAGNGYLGEAAFRKYEIQKFESKMGLVSGRKEVWMGLYAIKNSPILGFGSFAKDKEGYALRFLQKFDPDNISVFNSFRYETDIPAHSHIVCAWLWHGLFGLLFWLYILYLCLLFLWKYILKDPPLIAFSLLMIFIFLWNIFFSPFGDRIGTAMRISFILYSMQSIDKLNKLYRKIC